MLIGQDAARLSACLYHIGCAATFVILAVLVGSSNGTDAAGSKREFVIAAFGDSLSAGYGLPESEAFPARLEAALRETGTTVRVINAGVSGDTSAGGRARLNWLLADGPDAVIVELGANDALRGVDPKETRGNLSTILETLNERGVRVLLTGMMAPPNLGDRYAKTFNAIYPELALAHDVMLYPFFLDGVAAQSTLNQIDGIHPNAAGVAVIVNRILPYVRRLIAVE